MGARAWGFVAVMALALAVVFWTAGLGGCGADKKPMVVVYTSVDQVVAEPILRAYEAASGVRVLAVYDVEAAKTTGLVNRLLVEKARPQCDVFWNNERVQTQRLVNEGVLAAHASTGVADVPAEFRDPQGRWFTAGGRMRVLLVNTKLVKPEDYPTSVQDLLAARFAGHTVAVSNPLFGTAAAHAAALYALQGPEKTRVFFEALKTRGVQFVDGNSVVRDMVADGRAAVGLTDSDDAEGAVRDKAPVKVIVPDQDGIGTLVFSGTVSEIQGAPHRAAAAGLMAYLVSAEVERKLVEVGHCQLPRHAANRDLAARSLGLADATTTRNAGSAQRPVKAMTVPMEEIAEHFARMHKELGEVLLR